MKKILSTLMLCAVLAASAQDVKTQCKGTTKAGKQCQRKTADKSGLCSQHNPNFVRPDDGRKKCTALTKAGKPCSRYAKEGTLCFQHAAKTAAAPAKTK